MIILSSQKLYLRPIKASDNEAILSYRSDTITNKYQSWIPKNLSDVDQFIATIPEKINTPKTWYQLAIIEKNSDSIIGDIGIHFKDEMQCEVGCTLDKSYHGNGYATEALRITIDYLFHDLGKHRIVTSIDPENLPSIKLIERLGFRKEGYFVESLWIKDEWVDDLVYGLLHREWKTKTT